MAKRAMLDPLTRPMSSLEAAAEYPGIEGVVNLANPKNHYKVYSRCIDDGKHLCAEKPLEMRRHGRDADADAVSISERGGPITINTKVRSCHRALLVLCASRIPTGPSGQLYGTSRDH